MYKLTIGALDYLKHEHPDDYMRLLLNDQSYVLSEYRPDWFKHLPYYSDDLIDALDVWFIQCCFALEVCPDRIESWLERLNQVLLKRFYPDSNCSQQVVQLNNTASAMEYAIRGIADGQQVTDETQNALCVLCPESADSISVGFDSYIGSKKTYQEAYEDFEYEMLFEALSNAPVDELVQVPEIPQTVADQLRRSLDADVQHLRGLYRGNIWAFTKADTKWLYGNHFTVINKWMQDEEVLMYDLSFPLEYVFDQPDDVLHEIVLQWLQATYPKSQDVRR